MQPFEPTKRATPPRWPALLLMTLWAGCASAPQILPPAPVAPPLPPSARQKPDPWCSPTCSDAWRRLVDELLQRPTTPATGATSAPPGTTR